MNAIVTDDAAIREARFFTNKVKDSPSTMTESTYKQAFVERHWFASMQVLETQERTISSAYCRQCIDTSKANSVFATQLHVTTEKDILNVFKGMKHVACHKCGFEEYYPVKEIKPTMPDHKFDYDGFHDFNQRAQEAEMRRNQMMRSPFEGMYAQHLRDQQNRFAEAAAEAAAQGAMAPPPTLLGKAAEMYEQLVKKRK